MALGGAGNIGRLPELRRKIFWTFGLLIVYRLGIHVPVPGVNAQALADFLENLSGTLFGLFDMFSGGGLRNVSIFALGIMPYISASIIIQLLTVVSPELKRLQKEEGEAGRKKITQYTRYGTVLITLVQGFAIAALLEGMQSPGQLQVVLNPGWAFRLVTVITLTTGTIFLMWLGEQITDRGIGNGISLIIFGGIIARLPSGVMKFFKMISTQDISLFKAIFVAALMAGTLAFIVFMERAQRRIPIQYAKRVMGRKMMGGQTTHLPLRVNTSGVIPPIFASSILMFPATVASLSQAGWLEAVSNYFRPDTVVYNLFFVGLIMFFAYFYTAIIFDPKDIAENLRKQGGFIPGIRPGARTKEYIDRVLSRITLWGALYLAAICVLPMLLIIQFNVPFYYGGTGLLIVVGVGMDTMGQIESFLISRQYEGLMTKAKIRSRR